MNLKSATVVLSSFLLVPLVTGALSACSFDFSARYECQNSSSADAGSTEPAQDAKAGLDAGCSDAGMDAALSPAFDAGSAGFPLVWIVPLFSVD
jgi:hypothetical protein